VSYKEPKDYDELITRLKALGDPDKQVKALMQYFMESVEYDYVTGEFCKATHGDANNMIKEIDESYDCGDAEQREEALLQLKKLGYSDAFIQRARKHYGEILPAVPEKIIEGKIKMIQKAVPERPRQLRGAICVVEHPVIWENGLLKKGVCANYASFINQVCAELDIPAVELDGVTAIGQHVWNIIDGKHYDITYAMYIRDGKSRNENINPNDWLGCTDEQLFKLQPIRKITKIGDQTVNIDANSVRAQEQS
jgi:hypothetical protein